MTLNQDKTKVWNAVLLLIIILSGAVLRFYHFLSLPFMFDELSTAGRHYNSLSELIHLGVKENDVHPIGVYAFIYGWERLFGNAEWVVKLPFVLMGVACIYLGYRLGKLWFSETCGLFVALMISTMQFTITYSTLARPYISGLFFSLGMVIFWSYYFFSKEKNSLRYLAGFVICACLCMYNHYFSFLFALIVSFTGLLFLNRENLKYYIGSGLLLIVLFLPHVTITLYQLGRGGAGGPDGWLAAPENDFLFKFISYIFHYSWISGGMMLLIFLIYFIGFIRMPDHKSGEFQVENKFRLICIVWFMTPLLLGFFYSRKVNPILQFSALIFSFPYFIILVCSFIQEKRKFIVLSLLLLAGTANIYSLVQERRHYEIMLHQPSQAYFDYILQLHKSEPGKQSFAVLGTTETAFIEYYAEKYKLKPDYHIYNPKEDTPASLYELIKKHPCDYLVCGFIPDGISALFRDNFPKLIWHSEGYTFDINCFAKKNTPEKELIETNTADIGTPDKYWYSNANLALDSSMEWGPGYKAPLAELIKDRNSELFASIQLKPAEERKEGLLVLQLNKGDSMIYWQGSNLSKYFIQGQELQTIALSCRMIEVLKAGMEPKDYTVSIYYWNKDKQKVGIKGFTIRAKEGNPLIFGLFERMHF